MKFRPFHLISLVLVTIITYPVVVLAAPPTTSPYYTDTVNSYVQDQVSDDMEQLNGFLCLLSAMAPHLMVNSGDYIALIDENSCFNSGSGGQGSNTGASYLTAQVNSSRTSNTAPMRTKIWFDIPEVLVPMYATATQAASKTLPYGIFRLDYCMMLPTDTSCDRQRGFIDATRDGLAFYTAYQGTTTFSETTLQLSSTSSTNSGKGVVVKTYYNGIDPPDPSVTVFAYSPDYFYRDDGSQANGASGKCFSRSTRYAAESAWRYGLYDITTGERYMHQSGFPLEYVDTSVTPNETYNGYIGYYGLYMPVTVASGATVNKISYDTNPPTKTPYTLLKTGGKLTKYSTIVKSLADLHKLPIWYYHYSATPVPVTGGSITSMLASTYYQIYWDNTLSRFYVMSQYNSISGNMEPLATPGYMSNADMVAADIYSWGLSGWSQLLGGNFYIKGTDFALLDTNLSSTPVITQTQDVVYPQDFASINAAGGLQCIGDCPTAASIASSTMVSPGWGPFSTLVNYSYTLDPATGNLLDATSAPVVQTTTSTVYSGRLVTATDMAAIQAAKTGLCGTGCTYSQSDIDLLASPTYYQWQTSSDSWSQMAFLNDGTNTVIFYPPLPVAFTVPNGSAYENLAGSTISLEYGEFGNLWGIPNKCVDASTNLDCVFDDPATAGVNEATVNQRWTPQFSIPFDTTTGVVTASVTQGTTTAGTQFLVKALDKEIRLSQVNKNLCLVLGLTEPVTIKRLATYSDWVDPIPNSGDKTVLDPVPAPRIIHGVKQY